MRVLVVTNMYPTEANPQFGIFVKEQVESLRALGLDIDVLFVNAKEGRWRRKAYLLGFPRLWSALRRQRYDVIHAHYILAALIARAQWHAPLVVTHHGPELHARVQGPLCRWTRGMADEVIVVANWMVPELGAPGVHVIPCGVNFNLFRPLPQAEARAALGLPLDRRYVLFAGNCLNPRKRFPLVQDAVDRLRSRHPDVELLTVARQPHEIIPLYMNAADVFAMTSTAEGSAQVVKESMACGLPVVATDAGDNWDVIDGTPGCYRVGPDPAEIAARLEEAITPPRRTDGPARVTRFGLERVAHEVLAVYEHARSARRAASRPIARQRDPALRADRQQRHRASR
jgi:teichuronic acid biosynthesis glycosyltransferase TuaC